MPESERPPKLVRNLTSFLAGARTSALARMLWQHRDSVDDWGKAATLVAFTSLLAPVRAVETLATARAVRSHRMTQSPLFVVGHARSGTTMLFRLLAQDPQFGFVRRRQMIFPAMCATGRPVADLLLRGFGPKQRVVDAMATGPDEPEEEETAVGSLTGFSAVNFMYFPRHSAREFQSWALLRGPEPPDVATWAAAHRGVLRKASWLAGGRRIVSKNPWNTARLPYLLETWPDAPILHIVRHPFAVYLSAWDALITGSPLIRFADIADDEMRVLFLDFYRALLTAHLEQRRRVPTGQYAEVRYEDLVADPVGELRRVYDELDLPGWARFERPLRSYLESIAGYTPHRFALEPGLAADIAREWAFAFEQWGYDDHALIDADD